MQRALHPDEPITVPPGAPAHDTQYNTQVQRHPDDPSAAAAETGDIGQAVGPHVRELFVSCEPAEALVQQLEHLRPAYVALHDVASHASAKLLRAVAAAAGQPLQRLVIRRHSYGTTLATVEFVDCPSAAGISVRFYGTDAESDTATRLAIGRVLLCHASLVVAMVGDLPAHALTEQLQPLRQLIFSPEWQALQLQLMPLSATTAHALANLSAGLGAGSGLPISVAPLVQKPLEAWSHLSKTWNQLQNSLHPDGQGAALLTELAPARPDLQAMPGHRNRHTPPEAPLKRLAREAAALPGVQAVCVFEVATSRVLAQAGQTAVPADLARRGTLLLTAAATSRKHLGLHDRVEELLVMGDSQALGLRLLASHPGVALHLIFSPKTADWPQLRPRLMALDAAVHSPGLPPAR